MVRYLEKVKALTGGFKAFTIKQIPRSENKKADALSKIASTSFAHLSKQVLVKELKENSISEVEVLTVIEEEEDTWMTPIYKYLAEETLPADMKKAMAIKHKSWRESISSLGLVQDLTYWPSTVLSESEDSGGEHWKSRSKKKKSCREEDDLSQPWVCEEVDHFTPRIRYFDFLKTRMPSHIKTYDGSEDPKDHLKIFQAAEKQNGRLCQPGVTCLTLR
ncbi:hypothetical protein Tco_0072214 [Tanacetum coccineum]